MVAVFHNVPYSRLHKTVFSLFVLNLPFNFSIVQIWNYSGITDEDIKERGKHGLH